MFSSLVSFLPSALHIGDNNDQQRKQHSPIIQYDDDDNDHDTHTNDHDNQTKPTYPDPSLPVDELGVKKKERRNPNETFIFVRPPPSKSNHPLNLQVQLVPPNSRAPTGLVPTSRQSIDSTHTATNNVTPTPNDPFPDSSQGAQLTRTASNRSTASTTSTSGYGSTASFSSVATSSSTSSGRRTIIPLYNLQAHNVMTNTIVDAGTDAKIAKFQKRGIELIDLAILEPVEVWGDSHTGLPLAVPRTSADDHSLGQPTRLSTFSQRSGTLLHPGNGHSSRPNTPDGHHTPTSSAISLTSTSPSIPPSPAGNLPMMLPPMTSVITAPPAPGKRNLFGKFFNKKNSKEGSGSAPNTPSNPTFSLNSNHNRTPSVPGSGVNPASPITPTQSSRFGLKFGGTSSGQSSSAQSGTPTPTAKSPTAGHVRNLSAHIHNLAPSLSVTDLKRRSFSPHPPRPVSRDGGIPTRDASHHGDGGGLLHTTTSISSLATSSGTGHSQLAHAAPNTTTGKDGTASTAAVATRPPVLGIQPKLSSPLPHPIPKSARALMYVWFVKKWIKRAGPAGGSGFSLGGGDGSSGLFGGMLAVGGNGNSNGLGGGQVEVRFEWKRTGPKRKVTTTGDKAEGDAVAIRGRKKKVQETRLASAVGGSNINLKGRKEDVTESDKKRRRKSGGGTDHDEEELETITGGVRTRSPVSKGHKEERMESNKPRRRESEGIPHGEEDGENHSHERDDGDESDPEDSETPWTCTLKVRRVGTFPLPGTGTGFGLGRGSERQDPAHPHSASASASASASTSTFDNHHQQQQQPPVIRIKCGTLSPTPHHPKVVAMLKVPFPLPDVEIDRLGVKKRATGPDGNLSLSSQGPSHAGAPTPGYTGVTLTAEEIKDIVCSTGMWLVVREGFGGVGKVSRKGDGWRIRA